MSTLNYTSAGWPNCIRVSPILHWDYNHVWAYLREAERAAEEDEGACGSKAVAEGSSGCCSRNSKCNSSSNGGEAGAAVDAAASASASATPAASVLEPRPYCKLYDDGYTSLGSTKDTIPNPKLQRKDGSFAPAYTLTDGGSERGGRISKSKEPKKENAEEGGGRDSSSSSSKSGTSTPLSWTKSVTILCCGVAIGFAIAKH